MRGIVLVVAVIALLLECRSSDLRRNDLREPPRPVAAEPPAAAAPSQRQPTTVERCADRRKTCEHECRALSAVSVLGVLGAMGRSPGSFAGQQVTIGAERQGDNCQSRCSRETACPLLVQE